MAKLTTGDIKLIIRDMLGKRKAALRKSHVGRIYEPQLRQRFDELEALTPRAAGRPLAEALKDEDARHDGYGRALYYLTEAYIRLPDSTDEQRQAAKRVREAFIPRLTDLSRPYASEAVAAHAHAPALITHAADLKSLPVEGGTALDWARAFVESGKRIGSLLSDRGDSTAEAELTTNRNAGALLATTIGLLSRFRAALADEIQGNPKLDASLDGHIFGYYDELSRVRDAHSSVAALPVVATEPELPAAAAGDEPEKK